MNAILATHFTVAIVPTGTVLLIGATDVGMSLVSRLPVVNSVHAASRNVINKAYNYNLRAGSHQTLNTNGLCVVVTPVTTINSTLHCHVGIWCG